METTYTLASIPSRLMAFLVDAVLSMAIGFPIIFVTGGFAKLQPGGPEYSLVYNLFIIIVGIFIFILLHGKLLKTKGQTIGKKLLGIKIADMDGNTATIEKHILSRYAFSMFAPQIPMIGYPIGFIDMLLIFTKSKRTLHDYVGKTVVIKCLN